MGDGVLLGVRVASGVCVEVGDGVDVRVEVDVGGGVDEGVNVAPAVLVLDGVGLKVGEALGSSVAEAVGEFTGSVGGMSVAVVVAGLRDEGVWVAVTWMLICTELSVGLMNGSLTTLGWEKMETVWSRTEKSR
jgi:hypothetical protein